MTGPAVGYLIRIELRRRGKSLIVLGLLVAVVVATVVASMAGARRSGSAFDRYLESYNSPDGAAFGEPAARAELAELDAVEEAVDFEVVAAVPVGVEYLPLIVSDGGVVPFERMHPRVVDGRYPDRDAPREIALSERTSRQLDKGVGDTLTLDTYTPEAIAAEDAADDAGEPAGPFRPDGPAVELEVVGVVRDPGDIGARETDLTLNFLTPAFRDAYPPDVIGSLAEGTMIAVADGHSLAEVSKAMGTKVEVDPTFSAASADQQATPTMRAIGTALRLFALVAALAGLIAIGQAAARLQTAAGEDDQTLDALGATRVERFLRVAAPSWFAAIAGTVVGLGAAAAASPIFPIGLARRAEPDLGFHLDAGALAVGGAASMVVVVALVTGIAAWRVRGSTSDLRPGRVSRWGRAAADIGVPPSAVTGLTLASGTPGRPGRIAVGGTLLSVLGLLAALVFSASVDRLRTEPQLYGWGFDAKIEGANTTDVGDDVAALLQRLDADPDVVALSNLYTQLPVRADSNPMYATAVAEGAEALDPVIVRGDAPRGADEIAVGGGTLTSLGAHLGDTIDLSIGEATKPVRITGVTAFPVSEDGGSATEGVYLSPAGVTAFDADRACVDDPNETCTRTIAIGLRPGADRAAFVAKYQDDEAGFDVGLPRPPGEIDRLTAVEDLPRYMAIFLAALAAAAISFATATTVRQRRRDLAVLRVLGMTARHIRSVVVVLVLALTGFGALLGGAIGIIVGRQVWRAVMGSVSLPFSPGLPIAAVVLVPIAVVVLAQLVASRSRRSAGRVPAALVLRTE